MTDILPVKNPAVLDNIHQVFNDPRPPPEGEWFSFIVPSTIKEKIHSKLCSLCVSNECSEWAVKFSLVPYEQNLSKNTNPID